MFLSVFTYVLSLGLMIAISGAPVSNIPSEVVTLKCLDGHIEVDIQTNEDFKGAIYTEGSYRQNGCNLNPNGGTSFKLKFALSDCKTLNKNKGVYTNVIIVQNEDDLVTQADSAYEIKCDYNLKTTVKLEAQQPIQLEEPGFWESTSVASVPRGSVIVSNHRPVRNTRMMKKN